MATPPEPWLPIRTPRLLLRDFREADFDDVQAYGSDPEVSAFMDWGPNTPEDTRTFLSRVLTEQVATPRVEFGLAIELRDSGRAIGSIGLHPFDPKNNGATVGYVLGRAFWGRGLAHEAARALITAAIPALDLHRIVATCDVRNAGSYRVMEKLGMRREACFLRDRRIKGDWRDTYLYAVLVENWDSAGRSVDARTLSEG